MRSNPLRAFATLLVCTGLCSCSNDRLSSSELELVHLSVSLAKTKSRLIQQPTTPNAGYGVQDTLEVRRAIDSVLKLYHTDSATYVARSVALAEDPERAMKIYSAIRDSSGVK